MSGKGADKIPNPYFNWQAITALLGIILFCISVFLGKEKPDELEEELFEQEKEIIGLKIKEDCNEKEIQRLNDRLQELIKQIDDFEKRTADEISTLKKVKPQKVCQDNSDKGTGR